MCIRDRALFAAPRYLKSGITTIPQLLGERYDRPTKLWFSIAYIILYLFCAVRLFLPLEFPHTLIAEDDVVYPYIYNLLTRERTRCV